MKKYSLKYQKKIPEPIGKLQAEVIKKFIVLQKEALGIMVDKNNHFKSEFLENGISLTKKMIGHKIRDIESGGKVIRGKQSESLTECFIDLSNYALMGAMQAMYDFKLKTKRSCIPRCSYEIESKEGKLIKMRCKNCFNVLLVKDAN
ncbi:MAG: hypothetical protein WC609_03790 [Candidatus Paceibacterota bacterium]|jgi:hypothetical protein